MTIEPIDNTPQSAILLLGPTGSGKTPIGELLEQQGLHGHRCAHFDFGDHLRRIAAGTWLPPTLSPADIDIVTRAIQERMLLTDDQFYIAEGILKAFILEKDVQTNHLIILNGMPRHAGQAQGVEKLTSVIAVVELRCSPDIVLARIQKNTGGDRTERDDDALDAVRQKLRIYEAQTLPLVDHYRSLQIPVHTINVATDSSAIDMCAQLEQTTAL
jgi:adenylate kinase